MYPAINVNVDGTVFTIGTAAPANETATHVAVLSQTDFIDETPYNAADANQKAVVTNTIQKLITAIGKNDCAAVTIQVVYAETPFIGDAYPNIVAEGPKLNYVLPMV